MGEPMDGTDEEDDGLAGPHDREYRAAMVQEAERSAQYAVRQMQQRIGQAS
ncbi:hypothetical protein PRECH8_24610 [Insulibacter thermoxylanivorax]|uniref:Uncharacterized protein n=1 Tax=Insulibacter thermoxylanivorax TaxID=2749268 RepID=A0A916QES1_9BACL|nr:hypothetical protein PRECH8_24610 [Insulibacter thermoxylanivorax]